VALESILGVTVEEGSVLRVRPCVPDAWPGFTVRLGMPGGTRYEIAVENPGGRAAVATSASVDGEPAVVDERGARIPVARDGALHRVRVTLGPPR
jgi:cyclic beta-1,2-glucan synthetase